MSAGMRGMGAVLGLGMFLLGCPQGLLDDESQAAASSSAAARGPAGPTVTFKGAQVLLDGEITGSTRAIEDLGRLQKIDGLFDELRKKREAIKAKSDAPFEGRVSIVAEGETVALVFKSAFQTAAYAGYPHIAVKTPSGFVTVEAQIPGPLSIEPEPAPLELHVHLSETNLTVVSKLGSSVLTDRALPRPASDVDAAVEDAVVADFLRQQASPDPTPEVILHFDNREPFKAIAEVIDGASAAHRRLAGPDGSGRAFRLIFSVR